MHGRAELGAVQVLAEHARERLLAPELVLERGESAALPLRAGLSGGGAALDDRKPPLALAGVDFCVQEPAPGDGQELVHELARADCEEPFALRPEELGGEAVLRDAVEVALCNLEGNGVESVGLRDSSSARPTRNAALAIMSPTVGPEGSARISMRRWPPSAGL